MGRKKYVQKEKQMLNGLYCAIEMVLSLCCFYGKKSELTSRKNTFLKAGINDFFSAGRLNSAKRTGCISPAYTYLKAGFVTSLVVLRTTLFSSYFLLLFNSSGTGDWVCSIYSPNFISKELVWVLSFLTASVTHEHTGPRYSSLTISGF